jgi:predicted GNAT family acetyltransferase
MATQVRDNPDLDRYEVFLDGAIAGFAAYRLTQSHITFTHTEIDEAHEGAGLGSVLARGALDDVRKRGLTVIPLCPFIAGYIRRHPDEYADILHPSVKERVLADA